MASGPQPAIIEQMEGGSSQLWRSSESRKCPACRASPLEHEPDRLRRELRIGVALLVTALFAIRLVRYVLELLVPWILTSAVLRVPSSFTLAQRLNPWVYALFYLLLLQLAYRSTIVLIHHYWPQESTCKQCGYSRVSTPGFTWRRFFDLLFLLHSREEVRSGS